MGEGREAPLGRIARRRQAQRRRKVVLAAAVVVVALWALTRGDDAPPEGAGPDEVVAAFFDAQGRGDCAGVRDLVTEDSRGDDFLERCEAALAGFTPTVDDPRLAFEFEQPDDDDLATGERRTVEARDGRGAVFDPDDPPAGAVVWDGERWLVEVDPYVLTVGRSPGETVAAYATAYDDGDCEAQLDLRSERSWSADGQVTRDEFLERCTALATLRADSESGRVGYATVALQDAGPTSVVVEATFDGGFATLDDPIATSLERDGLRWVIDGPTNYPIATGAPFLELGYADLRSLLPARVDATGLYCSNPFDRRLPLPTGMVGIQRRYRTCGAELHLVDHGDDDEARRQAVMLGDQRAGDESGYPDAGPNRRVDVPGLPDAVGVLADCVPEGCLTTHVVQARDTHVIEVVLTDAGDPTAAGAVVQQQVERLSNVPGTVP